MNPFRSQTGRETAPTSTTLVKLREKIAASLTPSVQTPWSWTDSGGLYYGDDEAWLYRVLPGWLMENGSAGLDQLLVDLVEVAGERRLHLLAYSWEEPAVAPDGLSGAHAEYVTSSLRAVVPTTMYLIGVKLEADPAVEKRRTRLGSVVTETLDTLMGEWVPDLDTYTADRVRVSDVLDGAGATTVSGTRADMLEFWYTLGIGKDDTFIERDQSIGAGKDTLECVSVRSFSENSDADEHGNALAAGPGSTMVVSVRGKLRHDRERDTARLTGASVVIGRRSGSAARTLANTLAQQLRGVETKPLPMRQVVALDETLPCSVETVDPHLFGVDVRKLRRVGFHDSTYGGDRAGVFFGMVSPGYAHPRYVDLFSTPGHTTLVCGSSGAGKTFLVEHLAVQTHLLRLPLVVVSDGQDTGAALLTPPAGSPAAQWPPTAHRAPAQGLLDPFTRLPAALARKALIRLLTAAGAGMSVEDLFALEGELSRMAPAAMTSLAAVIAGIRDQRLAALLGRFTRTPAGKLIHATGPTALPSGSQVWDLAGVLAGVEAGPVREALVDLAVAAATADAAGGLLILDDVGTWAPGTCAAETREALFALGTLGSLVATTSDPGRLADGTLPAASLTVLLSVEESATAAGVFARLGVEWTDELAGWLASAGAVIEDGMVGSTALGLIWHAADAPRGLSVGPVPLDWVPVLTRGAADRYLADAVFA